MSASAWGALLPKKVADWINFDRGNSDWHYEGVDSESMASRQAEGVAYLWNLLSLHGVALLADEVGMGKTFQALGVAALLWKMKPDAKILVMAPNRDICAHWRLEYDAFVRFHYRDIDHCVKNDVDGGPVQSIQSCWRLEDLASAVEKSSGHMFLTTIYSLSGLVPQAEKSGDINNKARANAKNIHDRIKHAIGDEGFDLIIVDEAHYFRNRDGNSQRVNAAQAFFGEMAKPLSQKVLLMTATPSHTTLNDVGNILSYFVEIPEGSNYSPAFLMEKYGLRRFRRMRGNDGQFFSKRQYRHEKENSCDFAERPESEMFFALYQKKLVTELGFTRNNKSLLYGFLEGFESIGRTEVGSAKLLEDEDTTDTVRNDFTKAKDTELLGRLTGRYFVSFGKSPDHPKYGQLVEQCVPKNFFTTPRELFEDKHLIFVRRIPSVRELTMRINEAYDNVLAAMVYGAWGLNSEDIAVKKWQSQNWSRSGFEELLRNLKIRSPNEDDIEIGDENVPANNEDTDTQLGSMITDLFVIRKQKNVKNSSTDCSNVSLRFRKPESAFAMFLEPSSDYLQGGYEYYFQISVGEKLRSDYTNAAKDARLKKHGLFAQKVEAHTNRADKKISYEKPVLTVWSLVHPLLSESHQEKLKNWALNSPAVAENFAGYIKNGFLFASPVMLEIYAWFTEFNRSTSVINVEVKYAKFMEFVVWRIERSLLLCYFKSALDSFEILCEKIVDHKLDDWGKGWRVLTSLQNPAWYASGESQNRQRLILGFNSPFYPNVLVATSVFQEGVNLHLQCKKVHHYGIAGSPGDNEQRVGRVDRLFGKVNELLKVDSLAELEINYPFLKNSVDEDQVASFISRKFHVEEKMDDCTQSTFDKSVELTRSNWKEFLRKPIKSIAVKDPYYAKFDVALLPTFPYEEYKNHKDSDVTNHVVSLFKSFLDPELEGVFTVMNNPSYPTAILLIDPVVPYESTFRNQPIIVERNFSTSFSALISGTVYYISLKSPVATASDFAKDDYVLGKKIIDLIPLFNKRYPLVKICIDNSASLSHFYLYTQVDLPIFIDVNSLGNLSMHELSIAFQQLKNCSDAIEIEIFSGKRDLLIDQLHGIEAKLLTGDQLLSAEKEVETNIKKVDKNWKILKSNEGVVEQLSGLVEWVIPDRKKFEYGSGVIGDSKFLSILVLNSLVPFVRFESIANVCIASIAYPSVDMQDEERNLLKKWFDFVVSKSWLDTECLNQK